MKNQTKLSIIPIQNVFGLEHLVVFQYQQSDTVCMGIRDKDKLNLFWGFRLRLKKYYSPFIWSKLAFK